MSGRIDRPPLPAALVSVVRHPQEQEEPSRFLDSSLVCFLIELKSALLNFTN
jgi:hypothetical protein